MTQSTYTHSTFQIDERWTLLSINDFESFVKSIPEIYFKKSVSEDVKKSFGIVEKLLLHSYYEYEFFDIAVEKALMTFEMALRIRYRELSGEDWEKKPKKGEQKRDLKNLITWFHDKHYFEVTNDYFLDHIRDLRNSIAHPNAYGFGGLMKRQWILHPMQLINDLYEDPNLREQRKLKQKTLLDKVNSIIQKGAYLESNQGKHIISDAAIFLDNKSTPEIYYIIFIPIFKLSEIYGKAYDPEALEFFNIPCNKFNEVENGIVFNTVDTNENFKIIEADLDMKNELKEWQLQYHKEMGMIVHMHSLRSDIDYFFNQIRKTMHLK